MCTTCSHSRLQTNTYITGQPTGKLCKNGIVYVQSSLQNGECGGEPTTVCRLVLD